MYCHFEWQHIYHTSSYGEGKMENKPGDQIWICQLRERYRHNIKKTNCPICV